MNTIVTEHLLALFLGVAPEREEELQKLLNQYSVVAHVVADDADGNLPVMDAGAYVIVRFNHRILRAIWLLSFSAWEGYIATHVEAQPLDATEALRRFKSTLDTAMQVCAAENPDSIPFPKGIPQPGILEDHQPDSYARVAAEIAIFAAGWALLHETRHLMHQQEGTSGVGTAEERHKEELSCDEFATRFLLEKVDEYAVSHGESKELVTMKRQIGIHFAMYALAVIGRDNWGESSTHPAIQSRIDQALSIMEEEGFSKGAAIIACASFAALRREFPNAPAPLESITERAKNENWSPSSFADIGITP